MPLWPQATSLGHILMYTISKTAPLQGGRIGHLTDELLWQLPRYDWQSERGDASATNGLTAVATPLPGAAGIR